MDSPSGPLFPEITINTFHSSRLACTPCVAGSVNSVCTQHRRSVCPLHKERLDVCQWNHRHGADFILPLIHCTPIWEKFMKGSEFTKQETSGAGRCREGVTGKSRLSLGTPIHYSVVYIRLCFENYNFCVSAFGGLGPWNQKTNTVSLFLPLNMKARYSREELRTFLSGASSPSYITDWRTRNFPQAFYTGHDSLLVSPFQWSTFPTTESRQLSSSKLVSTCGVRDGPSSSELWALGAGSGQAAVVFWQG